MSTLPSGAARFRAFVQTKPRVILGSNSASRRSVFDEISKEHGLSYETATAGIDEKSIRFEDPKELVVALGYEKAKALLGRSVAEWTGAETYLITGDQVVVHEGRILEKPESAEEIRSNVHRFAETPAQTVGSVVCTHVASGRQEHRVDVATIRMKPLPDLVVDALIEEGAVFETAGGLLAEHPLVSPHVTGIEGGLDAIMGLSKETVMVLLTRVWEATCSIQPSGTSA